MGELKDFSKDIGHIRKKVQTFAHIKIVTMGTQGNSFSV
jgi:hypothetical protein